MQIIDLIKDPNYSKKKVLEELICFYLNINKEKLYTYYDLNIPEQKLSQIIEWYKQYDEDKKPLEYIFWYCEFFWLKFKVNQDTLIPRPETEYMIEAVNKFIKADSDSEFNLIDIWTGCGVLWLTILYLNQKQIKYTFLCELSPKALTVAKDNFNTLFQEKNDLDINFIQSDLLEYFLNKNSSDNQLFDTNTAKTKKTVIVANLPYIPVHTFDTEVEDNVKLREPRMAFIWWEDWLDLYRKMFNQLIDNPSINIENYYLSKENITMFLEMTTQQIEILSKEYWTSMKFETVATFHFNIKIVKTKLW